MIQSSHHLDLGARMLSGLDEGPFLYETVTKVFQVSNAAISLTASSVIAVMIAHPNNGGLSSPYRRIIFGLSISDIIQSFGLFSGPFSVPSWVEKSWGRGNEASCQANGFMVTISLDAVPMYTCFLCLYYLCKLKFRMTDEEFSRRVERYIHAIIIALNLVLATTALAMDVFHTNTYHRSFCYFASVPLYCRFVPETVGECDAVIQRRVELFTAIVSIGLPTACIFGIFFIMALLFWHAFAWRKIIQMELPTSSTSLRDNSYHLRNVTSEVISASANEDGREQEKSDPHETGTAEEERQQEEVEYLSNLLVKETVMHASSYISAFCLTYLPMIVSYWNLIFSDVKLEPCSVFLQLFVVFFFPLGGLFNILVYTRPEVASLRRIHPECSRIRALWLVIRAGGKVPASFNGQHASDSNFQLEGGDLGDPVISIPTDFESINTPPIASENISSNGMIKSSTCTDPGTRNEKETKKTSRRRYYNCIMTSSAAASDDSIWGVFTKKKKSGRHHHLDEYSSDNAFSEDAANIKGTRTEPRKQKNTSSSFSMDQAGCISSNGEDAEDSNRDSITSKTSP